MSNTITQVLFDNLRWPLGCIRVLLFLPQLGSFRGGVSLHLPVIAYFISLGHILKPHLLLGGHGLRNKTLSKTVKPGKKCFLIKHCHNKALRPTFHLSEHLLENSAKPTEVPGWFFLCSSRHFETKYAYEEVLPLGLFGSFPMVGRVLKKNNKY